MAHNILGLIYAAQKEHEQTIAAGEKAIALDPNNDSAYANLSNTLHYVGRGEEALDLVQQAMRLNPHYPAFYLTNLASIYWLLGRYEEVIATEKRHLARNPDQLMAYLNLAVSYSLLGQEAEARTAAAEVLRLNPDFSLEVARSWPYKDPADLERAIAALRKAGLK
jgi:tetratricopeptide (TPR) repeat protein